jgi:hypothetical protein
MLTVVVNISFAASDPWRQCPGYPEPDYLPNLAGEAANFNLGVQQPTSWAAFSETSRLVAEIDCIYPAVQLAERDPSIRYYSAAGNRAEQEKLRDALLPLYRSALRVAAMEPDTHGAEAPALLALRRRIRDASMIAPRSAVPDEVAYYADEIRPFHYDRVGQEDRVAVGAAEVLGRADIARLLTPGAAWDDLLAFFEQGTAWLDRGVELASPVCAARASEVALEAAALDISYATARLDAFGPEPGSGEIAEARDDSWRQARIGFRAATRRARTALEAAGATHACADDLDADQLSDDARYLLSQATDGLARVELLQAVDPGRYPGGVSGGFGSPDLEEAVRYANAHAASEYATALRLWALRIDAAQGDVSHWEFNTELKNLVHDATADTSGARDALCGSVEPDPDLGLFPELRDPTSPDNIVGRDTLELIDDTWKCHLLGG